MEPRSKVRKMPCPPDTVWAHLAAGTIEGAEAERLAYLAEEMGEALQFKQYPNVSNFSVLLGAALKAGQEVTLKISARERAMLKDVAGTSVLNSSFLPCDPTSILPSSGWNGPGWAMRS